MGVRLKSPPLALGYLEIAVNRYLRLDERTLASLADLSGKTVALEVIGVTPVLYVDLNAEGLRFRTSAESPPHVLIRGTPGDLLRMTRGPEASERVFAGDVVIEGDTRLVQQVKSILDDMDVDWEEEISSLLGDPLAHQVGNLARGALGWWRSTTETLRQDVAEYLVEEKQMVARRERLEAFSVAVDSLRDDTARLEKRIERLTRLLAEDRS